MAALEVFFLRSYPYLEMQYTDGLLTVPGDSGAWVFDKSTGRVCGHVLAWSEKSQTAYIAPMQVLLEDIARTLGACTVTLPGCQDDNTSAAAVPQSVNVHGQQRRRNIPIMAEQFPVDLRGLNLGGLEEPATAIPLSRMVGSGRGLREVSSSYRAGPPPVMTRAGGMERQRA
jgi:hypothetical protein